MLKPVEGDGMVEVRYVGAFPRCELVFELEDGAWSNRLPHRSGQALRPGTEWRGPHCGTPYWIERRRRRIYRPRVIQNETDFVRVEHREYLDDYVEDYTRLARRISEAKEGSGGRFYVTEAGSIWTPSPRGAGRMGWGYRYVGNLWDLVNDWYPKFCG